MDCGPFLALHTDGAIKQGLLSENDLNLALANLITVQMRLGMFDGEPSAQPYGNLGPRDVCTPAHQQLALEAARQGIVLLQNKGNSLPLSPLRQRTVGVIGPNSDVTVTMIGNYAGKWSPIKKYIHSIKFNIIYVVTYMIHHKSKDLTSMHCLYKKSYIVNQS